MTKISKDLSDKEIYISEKSFNFNLDSLLKELGSYFNEKKPIFVGVSGGPDSMVLSFLLNQWSKKKIFQLNH